MTEKERIYEVEKRLKIWRRLQERAWAAEEDAANVAFSHGEGGPVQSSSVSDKTFRGAELLAAARPDIAWVDAITAGMEWMKSERPELYNLIRGHYGMIYMRGYRKKTAKSFTESYRKVYGIGPTSYYQRRQEALRELAGIAQDYGLVSPTRSYRQR